jgi:hypothetical protein
MDVRVSSTSDAQPPHPFACDTVTRAVLKLHKEGRSIPIISDALRIPSQRVEYILDMLQKRARPTLQDGAADRT